jgi:hypothetical protein
VTGGGGVWVVVTADGVVRGPVEVVKGDAVGLGFGPPQRVPTTVIATTTTIKARQAATTAATVGHGMDRESMSCPGVGFCS